MTEPGHVWGGLVRAPLPKLAGAQQGRVHTMEDDELPHQRLETPPAPVSAPPPPPRKRKERTMEYKPRGKVAVMVAAMKEQPAYVWSAAEAAEAMGIKERDVSAHMETAIRHGVVVRTMEKNKCRYALPQPPAAVGMRIPILADHLAMQVAAGSSPAPAPEPEPAAAQEETDGDAFNAALWADGDLVIFGAQENDDGSFTLNAEQTAKLCRLLHGQGPEA